MRDSGDRYEIINRFKSQAQVAGDKIDMVTVRFRNGVFTMPEAEWRWVYGECHPERWKKNDAA